MFEPAQLVFIDETVPSTNMVQLHGRRPRGVRLIGHMPHGHWKCLHLSSQPQLNCKWLESLT